jgi:GTP-binding protein
MIKQARYVKSIVDLKDQPEVLLPQVLLLGRSNVGKSSFINALTNRKNLARISNTPGKTLTLNFYNIDESFYLVDAPGYGYARRSKSMKDDFIMMIENFIMKSDHLKIICLLVDFKVGPTEDDIFTHEFIRNLDRKVLVVATKKDKVPKTHQFKQEKLIKEKLGFPSDFYAYSSVTKENIDQIITHIQTSIKS